MDEPYPIEVLHIVNPHVIFVESLSQGAPEIEQVGIFGILPVNKTIDIDGEVIAERCENWTVAANTILRELLAENKNCAYFISIQAHERSTIFDQSVYKFGDIILETDKSRTSITDYLVHQSVAVLDEALFHQRLSSGSLKIKLNSVRTEEVLNLIKKYYQKQKKVQHDWHKTISQQTSLHQETKMITARLTEKNLKMHAMTSIMNAVECKEKDFNLCKDADLVSVGCGSRRRTSNTGSKHEDRNGNSTHSILNDVKKFLETNGQTKENNNTYGLKRSQQSSLIKNVSKSEQKHIKDIHNNGLTKENVLYNQKQYQMETFPKQSERSLQEESQNDHGRYEISQVHEDRNPIETANNSYRKEQSTPIAKESPLPKKTPPKPKECMLVFCPDMEMSNENLKKFVPKKVVEEYYANPNPGTKVTQENRLEIAKSFDREEIDSDVDFKINVNDQSLQKAKSYEDSTHNCTKTPHKETPQNTEIKKKVNELSSSILRRKLQELKTMQQKKQADSSLSSHSDTSVKDTSSSTESKVDLKQKPNACHSKIETQQITKQIYREQPKHSPNDAKIKDNTKTEFVHVKETQQIVEVQPKMSQNVVKVKRNVNPFQNLDGSKSVFVEKLIAPILMVHTKNNNLVLPQCDLRDIPFKFDIHCMLKNMKIQNPKRLQSVSWSYILRGHSVFMISPSDNGKTLGYVPAVCNLVTDSINPIEGVGPLCIIVCATALSVSEIQMYCVRFLGVDEQVVVCYHGLDLAKMLTSLLNGCHILICTAPMLVTLLEVDFGVDLRRLMTLVFDDCERLAQVYGPEINTILKNVNNMLKKRSDRSFKVQYIAASRQWCDFLTPLAKKAPDTIIAIGASQECVLYSKTKTSVNFVKNQDSKINHVVEFLKEIDTTKRTVIVCRADEEVDLLEKTLKSMQHVVFACNSSMTLHHLYKLNDTWANYQEPVLGPILICCDGNLTHFNITNANYLVHYSMPALFSLFCKRFSVLNENYSSIFEPENENVKIKILLDETNVEQLPKILNFIKRCTKEEYPMLDNVLQQVMEQKDFKKAENFTPICNNMLMLGECADIWNCADRHIGFKEFDEPKDWMPKQGIVTFKIVHYDSAVAYSARLNSNVTKSITTKYPNNYNTLSLKMGRYYSKEANRKLHGEPKVGDLCSVAIKQNFFERCKVLKVIPGDRKTCHVLINLIDEEQLTVTKDVQLYYLPDELKFIETHVVKVRLANLQPKGNDVTFSITAKEDVQKIVERDGDQNLIYIRGRIVMTVGNCIFVDTAEACADLSSLGETVVKRDLKKELLVKHAEPNPQHMNKLKALRGAYFATDENEPATPKAVKLPRWAHLDKDEFSSVYFSMVIDAGTFFVRNAKFEKVVNLMLKDIEKYVADAPELTYDEIYVGNIVLAEVTEDSSYERARIDEIDNNTVKCFFVDNGDWRHVPVNKLKPITDSILHWIPFQAIECRLVGIKPPGDDDNWPDFSIHWLDDHYCYEDNDGNMTCLYAKCFTKEKAIVTGGHKYGVVLFDTSTDQDLVINKMMVELNFAKENEDESKYINEPMDLNALKSTYSSSDADDTLEIDKLNSNLEKATPNKNDIVPFQSNENFENYEKNKVPKNILFKKPIRSVPLVDDSDSDISDKWDVVVDKSMLAMFGQPSKANVTECKPETVEDEKSNKSEHTKKEASKIETNAVADVDANRKANEASSACSSVLKEKRQTKESLDTTLESTQPQPNSDYVEIADDKIKALNDFNIPKQNIISNYNRYDAVQALLKKVEKSKLTVENLNKKDAIENATRVDDAKEYSKNDTLDSDDLSLVSNDLRKTEPSFKSIEIEDAPRTPKLVWRQNKESVTLKINLIGAEDYTIDLEERRLKFNTWHNDTNYEFDLTLYGVIKTKESVHTNKGQYIQVKLVKMLKRNWLNLTKDFTTKKWIVYDVDALEFSSGEEDSIDDALRVIKHNHERKLSESEDDDFEDDVHFTYKKNND